MNLVAARGLDAAAVVIQIELDGVNCAVLAEIHPEPVLGRTRSVTRPTIRWGGRVVVFPVRRLARGVQAKAIAGARLRITLTGVVHGVVRKVVAGNLNDRPHIDGDRTGNRVGLVHSDLVDKDLETRSATVLRSVPVPDDGDLMAVIEKVVQYEVVPSSRNQRLQDECVVGLWLEPEEPGKDRVDESRVEVVLAMAGPVVTVPGSGIGMVGLGDVRLDAGAVGFPFHVYVDIGVQSRDVIALVHLGLFIIPEDIGQRLQGLGGGEGPRLSAPMTTSPQEFVLVIRQFDRARAVRGLEVVRIVKVLPGRFVAGTGLIIGQIEGPRNVTYLLPPLLVRGVGAGVVDQRLRPNAVLLVEAVHVQEEVPVLVPQTVLHVGLQRGCLLIILRTQTRVASHRGDSPDCQRIPVHVRIQRRPVPDSPMERIIGPLARGGPLHRIPDRMRPEQPQGGIELHLLNVLIIFDQLRQQSCRILLVAMDLVEGPHVLSQPGRVAVRLGGMLIDIERSVVLSETPVTKPLHLIELMPRRGHNRSERTPV